MLSDQPAAAELVGRWLDQATDHAVAQKAIGRHVAFSPGTEIKFRRRK